jgi:hypothetical protein
MAAQQDELILGAVQPNFPTQPGKNPAYQRRGGAVRDNSTRSPQPLPLRRTTPVHLPNDLIRGR